MKPLAFLDDVKVPSTFVIVPSDAINKSGADLVLTGVPAEDRMAINNAITMLHTMRVSTDIAIRIDFLGGTINLGTVIDEDGIVIPEGYDNIHLYGNGVKIVGDVEEYGVLTVVGENCILDGFNVGNLSEYGVCGISSINSTLSNCISSGNDIGIFAINSTLSNCIGTSTNVYGVGISATNSTLSNCTGSGTTGIQVFNSNLSNCTGTSIGDESKGIDAHNSLLSNCTGTGNNSEGINAMNGSIVQGCDGTEGGIYISSDSLPNDRDIAENLNKGTITIEGEV